VRVFPPPYSGEPLETLFLEPERKVTLAASMTLPFFAAEDPWKWDRVVLSFFVREALF